MKKNILIIGGMGPQASLLLHQRLIQRAIKDGARDNEDFPVITHLSISIKDFISADAGGKKQALKVLLGYLYCLWQSRVHTYCYSL